MTAIRPLLLAAFLALLAFPAFGQPAGGSCTPARGPLVECRLRFEEHDYPFHVFLPPTYDGHHPVPALLVLHGGGGNGRQSIAAFKTLAEQNGILLIAPTLPSGPEIEPKVPALFRELLDAVRHRWTVDSRRIYLFGHSAGGVFTFDAAMLDSDLFAAAAVHAGVIDPEYDWILKRARRKTPIALYIGDADAFFSLARARRTRDVLLAEGFPLHYTELPHHDHNYAAVAEMVNRDAWKFLQQYSLAE